MGKMIDDDHITPGFAAMDLKTNSNANNTRPAVTKPQYDPTFTDQVIKATGPNAHPRLAEVMPSLLRHLHDFAREVNLTVAEWTAAVDLINECGQMSTDRRNETGLLCDILGLESLVDEITSKQLSGPNASSFETPSAVLGPFYRNDAPLLPPNSSIVRNLTPATPWYDIAVADSAHISGRVLDSATRKPVRNAIVDVWLTAPNGLYEQQDESQPEMNLRGRFETDAEGRYAFYALRPVAYPIPSDGPAGRFLQMLDRSPYRPGHIHFIVSGPGYRAITTQIFDDRDEYITNDAVFAVKDELVVKFVPREGDPQAKWSLEYDFFLGAAAPANGA